MRISTAALLFLVLACRTPPSARRTVPTPTGRIQIDRTGPGVRIAIEAGASGIASLLIARGSTVSVLHASAALGTAIYVQRRDGTYGLEQPFAFQCRSHDCEAAHLRAQGWAANTAPGGHADRTFTVHPEELRGEGPARVLVTYSAMPTGPVTVWPDRGTHGQDFEALLKGDPPASATFSPERWESLAEPATQSR